jgi:hypothetical protein
MKSRKLPFLLPAVLVLGLSGCATKYAVRVDALSSTEVAASAGSRCVLVSAMPEVGERDLFFKEVARHLEPVLRENGYKIAGPAEQADIRIAVNAYLSEPMVETVSHEDPVYVHTHGYSRTVRVPVVNSDGKVVRYHHYRYYDPPRIEMAGWVHRDQQVTVHDKVLRLSAREILGGEGLSDELWTIRVSLRSAGTDYRWALPYLLVAASPYIGKRTDGEEIIILSENDERLAGHRGMIRDGR